MTTLINLSITEGSFPQCLKIAKVSPLFKQSGSKKDTNSYRPVAINPLPGKCFEAILLDRLQTHLKKNNVINKNQFGFTKGSNTEVATVHLLSEIYNNIDKKRFTSVLFLDLTKAFDCVNHDILIGKLRKLQIPSQLLNVLSSYLSDRFQYVEINETKSAKLPVFDGVFQGSKLAACLFIIYINNIFSLPLKGKSILYADDIALVYGTSDPIELKKWMEEDLILIKCWLENHFLKINLQKTKYIYFNGRARNDPFIPGALNVLYDGTIVERVESFDYLGLTIDEKLNFRHHVEKVRSRTLSMCFALRRIRNYISLETANQLYFSYVHSLFIYMNSCWNVSSITTIDLLVKCQKKILRIIHVRPPRFPSKELFSQKILPIAYLNQYQTLLLTFKMIKNIYRSNIEVKIRENVTNRITRQSTDFYIPHSISQSGRNDFFKRGFDSFNRLPPEIKRIRCLEEFKSSLKSYLFQKFAQEN